MEWQMYLDLFGEGGAGGATGGGEGAAAEAGEGEAAQDGQQEQASDKASQFRELIKGEYKAEFDSLMQQNLDRRFKAQKALEKQVADAQPIMELLAGKYGVSAEDLPALLKAAEEDDGYYEEEAAEKGLTVEQLKQFKKLERENAQLKAAEDEQKRRNAKEQTLARWAAEESQMKQIYPGFDLNRESENPTFARLLAGGVQMQAAYLAVHSDEILSGAMAYASDQAKKKTVSDIRARGMRPDEGVLGKSAPARSTIDPSKLTKAERDDLARRAKRGERITFDGT